MKVIFLDVDGVLAPRGSHECLRHDVAKLKELYVKMNADFADLNEYDIGSVTYDWYPKALANIKELVTKCDARIVVTSSMRISRSITELKALFSIHDLGEYVMDKTENFEDSAAEIQSYLNHAGESISQYVVIDDKDMRKTFRHHFVYVKDKYFTKENLEEAISILNMENMEENEVI